MNVWSVAFAAIISHSKLLTELFHDSTMLHFLLWLMSYISYTKMIQLQAVETYILLKIHSNISFLCEVQIKTTVYVAGAMFMPEPTALQVRATFHCHM